MSELNKCHVCGSESTADDLLGDGKIVHYCSNVKCFLHDLISNEEQWQKLNAPQSEWVSVDIDDEIPLIPFSDDSRTVDLWSKSGGRLCDCYRVCGVWHDDMGDVVLDATHYIPLPKPPKGE